MSGLGCLKPANLANVLATQPITGGGVLRTWITLKATMPIAEGRGGVLQTWITLKVNLNPDSYAKIVFGRLHLVPNY